MIIAKLYPLIINDPKDHSKYEGYAYCNLVRSKGGKLYLSIICKIKFKQKGKWLDLDSHMVRIPIPGMNMMLNFIKKNTKVKYKSKSKRLWKFWTLPKETKNATDIL